MSGVKISEMVTSADLTGAEVLPIVKSGVNRKTTVEDVRRVYQSADHTLIASPDNGDLVNNTTNNKLYLRTGGAWVEVGSGNLTVATIDSQTKSANGAVITGGTLVSQTADASYPGLVSTGTQTFAGTKTFNGNVYALQKVLINGNGFDYGAYDLQVLGDSLLQGVLNMTGAVYLGTATSDPAANSGGIYYNTSTNKFRGCINSVWTDLGSGTPGGSDTQIQFNDGGAFGGDADLVWDKTNNELRIGGGADMGNYKLQVTGSVAANGSAHKFGGDSNSNSFTFATLATPIVGYFVWDNTDFYFRNDNASGKLRFGAGATNDFAILSENGEFWIGYTADQGDYKLQVNGNTLAYGGMSHRVTRTTDANYAVVNTDYIIELAEASSPRTLTLPTVGSFTGRVLVVAHNLGGTWAFNSAVTKVTGGTTTEITLNGLHYLYSNGSEWVLSVTGGATEAFESLTDGATITWDYTTGAKKYVTLGGNRTLDLQNTVDGDTGILKVTQDGTGSRTLSLTGNTPAGWALTTAAGSSSVLGFINISGTIYWSKENY
jgi:hypothetical protein